MSLYDYIIENKETVYQLADYGLLRGNVMRDVDVYESYKQELCTGKLKMQIYTDIAEEFGISEELVRKIIQAMR